MKDLNPITDIDVMEKYIKSEMGYDISREEVKFAVQQLNELVGEQQARQKIVEMNNAMNRKVVTIPKIYKITESAKTKYRALGIDLVHGFSTN